MHLIRSPAKLQDKEAAHLTPDEGTNMPEGTTFEVNEVACHYYWEVSILAGVTGSGR